MRRDGQKVASDLIECTIKVIGRDGLDKASTRSIAGECGLQDAYIYQHFASKEELFVQAFLKVDTEMTAALNRIASQIRNVEMSAEQRFRALFDCVWHYLMENPETCRFYMQYYYSPYYLKYSAQDHLRLWTPLLLQVSGAFSSPEETKSVLRLSLNTILNLAVKMLTDEKAQDEDAAEKCFATVFAMMQPYLRK